MKDYQFISIILSIIIFMGFIISGITRINDTLQNILIRTDQQYIVLYSYTHGMYHSSKSSSHIPIRGGSATPILTPKPLTI